MTICMSLYVYIHPLGCQISLLHYSMTGIFWIFSDFVPPTHKIWDNYGAYWPFPAVPKHVGYLIQSSFVWHSNCIYPRGRGGPNYPTPRAPLNEHVFCFYMISYLWLRRSEIIMGYTDHTMQYLNKWATWINYYLPVTLLLYTPHREPQSTLWASSVYIYIANNRSKVTGTSWPKVNNE